MKRIQRILILSGIALIFTGCAQEAPNAETIESSIYIDESLSVSENPFESSELSEEFVDESETIISAADFGITVYEDSIEITGLKDTFEIIFTADNHISLWDERDPEWKDYIASRYDTFRNSEGEGSEHSFADIIDYVSAVEPDLLLLGGDITDTAAHASIEYAENLLEELTCPWIYGMGNHDFNGEKDYFSNKSYEEYLPRFERVSNSKDGYQYVEYENFIVFAVDDAGNQVSEASVRGLQEACSIKKPIILICHVPIEPLEESTLVEDTVKVWGAGWNGYSRVLMGEHANKPNAVTKSFLDIVLGENSPVKLVLSGHIHFYHKDNLKENIQQVITGPGFKKELVKITLVPETEMKEDGYE